jgi:predicted enzyme related to lactoylglutathione lyase
MPNPVMKWQILARDAEGVAAFYRDLFGWTLNNDNALGYRELRSGAVDGIDGGVWPSGGDYPNFVQLFVQVDDIDASIEKATAAGAKVLVPKSALPDGDTMAILQDPHGMSFGLMSAPAPR